MHNLHIKQFINIICFHFRSCKALVSGANVSGITSWHSDLGLLCTNFLTDGWSCHKCVMFLTPLTPWCLPSSLPTAGHREAPVYLAVTKCHARPTLC